MKNTAPLTGQRYAKSLVKCVDVSCIHDWIPEQNRRRVDLTTAWNIIKIHYCAALVGRGVCPIQCEKCRKAISGMFPLDDARNAEALLTWRAKDRSAAMIEELIAAQKHEAFPAQETDNLASLFPKKKVENLFSELEADYQ